MRPSLLAGRYAKGLVLSTSLLITVYLLFIQSKIQLNSPLLTALWDRAHVVLFTALTLVFDFALLQFRPARWRSWLLKLATPMLALAAGTEALQSLTDRTASWGDVGFDAFGIGIAICFLLVYQIKNALHLRLLLSTIACTLFLYSFWSPIEWCIALYQVTADAPMISNMERIADRKLWKRGDFIPAPDNPDNTVLKIAFTEQKYSGSSMRAFYSDWSTYSVLTFRVYNTQNNVLTLGLRINDELHDNSEKLFSDRFETTLMLNPGWNNIQIALQNIEKAPKHRLTDSHKISHFRLYAIDNQLAGTNLYVDDVQLQ